MNLLFSSIESRPDDTWLFSWTTTGADFYRVILFGKEIGRVPGDTGQYLWDAPVPSYTKYPPPIEVVEELTPAVSEQYPPFIIIQWYNDTIDSIPVDHYILQQFNPNNSKWVDGPRFAENSSWVYSIVTPILLDGKTYNFRVVAVGPDGSVSCARPYRVNMVCPPILQESKIAIRYDNASQNVVITGV